MRVALTCKRDVFLLGKGRQVREYFFDHRRKVNRIVARDTAQLAHLEQGLCHVRHPLGLLLQQPEQARCIGVDVGVLGAKQLNLGLHERKWRAQLVRRIARKLSLCGKSLVKAGNHVVKRRAAAPEFRGTSSLIFVSARLSGRTLSTCVAKKRNGRSACPLTK